MRLELNDDNKIVETTAVPVENENDQDGSQINGQATSEGNNRPQEDSLGKTIKKQQRAKFKELDGKGKVQYIWDYYKWFFLGAVVAVFFITTFIRDYRENLKPVYIDAIMLNCNFAYDDTNTLKGDYESQFNIDTEVYNYYIDYGINLSEESFDTYTIANQQKIVASYQAGDLDVVIGPVDVMEGSANCDCYADLTEVLPQDLMDELKDRDYEFYIYDAEAVDKARYADEDPAMFEPQDEYPEPYIAGIYLDNCAYLNNNGEYGAYDLTTDEKKRPIFTIAVNSQRQDHAVEFLRFLVENK